MVESLGRRGRAWRWLTVALVPLAAAGVATGVAYAVADEGRTETVVQPLGPGDVTVRIGVHHTLFEPDHLTVVEGTRVRFLLVNEDPINHELITGGAEVHRRHATGTEAEHPAIPGEVSVRPNRSAITTFTFDDVGTYEFACHLPSHYEYGMRGTIDVVPAP